jgi:hypothetical protein
MRWGHCSGSVPAVDRTGSRGVGAFLEKAYCAAAPEFALIYGVSAGFLVLLHLMGRRR